MQFEINDAAIKAKANAVLDEAVTYAVNEYMAGWQFKRTLNDRVKELANSCLDKVAFDLVQEMKPRMREDVQAAYQAMVKAKAAKMMKALEKGQE